jgi:Ca2+/Na+ antiporter
VISLVVVVAASVTMERTASDLGARWRVPEIVIGGLVLAAVTSLPNAVAAVYLALRGRGAAVLSIALNSNALNVVVGLLLPGAVVGLGGASSLAVLVAAWYLGLTAVTLAIAHRQGGLRRPAGALIVAAYGVFVVWLLIATL